MDEKQKIAEPRMKPRRRWYQYSLRTLLIFVTLAGCGFGWLGAKVREAREQQAVVAFVKMTGGIVSYDHNVDSGPAWLHALLGDDCFRSVREITYVLVQKNRQARWKVSDGDLEQFKGLTRLEFLALDDTEVTDAGLARLQGLTQLWQLSLRDTQVTDAGLDALQRLAHLASLDLEGTKVTDAGLESLKRLTQLTELGLIRTKVTDAGLEHLKGLSHLVGLYLEGTKVTEVGVAKLQKALPNCKIER